MRFDKVLGQSDHLNPTFWAIEAFEAFDLKHMHMQPLTSTNPLFKIFCPDASKRLLKAIFFRKHLVKFAGLAFKQKAALSFNTAVAAEFWTNNMISSNRKTVSGGAGGRGRGITRKLLSYWILSHTKKRRIYLLFTSKSQLCRKEMFITRKEKEMASLRPFCV